jgi:DNA-binding NtrC family response regulator
MLNEILVLMNEREPAKREVAHALEHMLLDRARGVRRIPITQDAYEVVLNLKPKILVIDYLLGDIGTGLDLLDLINLRPPHDRPEVYFLTDEPSVRVATEALQKGAAHYIPLAEYRDLVRILEESRIDQIAPTKQSKALHAETSRYYLSRELQKKIDQWSTQHTGNYLITGSSGVGKHSLATMLYQRWSTQFPVRIVDLKTAQDSVQSITGLLSDGGPQSPYVPSVGRDFALIIIHLEEDAHEIMATLEAAYLKGTLNAQSYPLVATCSEQSVVTAWSSLFPADRLHLASLSERRAEIPHMTRAFRSLLPSHGYPQLAEETLNWLMKQDFPGELHQLREVTISSLTALYGRPPSEQSREFEKRKIAWESLSRDTTFVVPYPRLVLLRERYGSAIRPLAAALGTTPRTLRQTLLNVGIA